MDRVPSRPRAERVEVKARLMQRFKGRRVVDRGQANQSPVVQIRPHASAFAGLEQLSQSTVPKAFDHTAGDVNRGLTSVKSGFTDRTSLTRFAVESANIIFYLINDARISRRVGASLSYASSIFVFCSRLWTHAVFPVLKDYHFRLAQNLLCISISRRFTS